MRKHVKLDATSMVEIRVLRGRDHIWSVIQDLSQRQNAFTQADIVGWSNCQHSGDVSTYLQRLVRGGYVAEIGTSDKGQPTYRLVKPAQFAPVLDADGKTSLMGRVRDHLWRTMKMLDAFTVGQLAETAATQDVGVSPTYAQTYVKRLHDAG